MAFELIPIDAETQDFSVQRLAGNSQLGSCPRWARDSAPALRERFLDHLPLAICERWHQSDDRTDAGPDSGVRHISSTDNVAPSHRITERSMIF
jgi:hypothetical protein